MKSNDSFSDKQAESSLQQILSACGTNSDASLEELEAHSRKQLRSIHLLKAVLILLLALLVLVPVLLISPDIDVTESMNEDSLSLTIRTDSLWPVNDVSVVFEGEELPVTREDDAWLVTIPRDGLVTISASTIFTAQNSVEHEYSGIPVLLPEVTDYRFENGQLIAAFTAGTNPIDYAAIHAEDEDGSYTPVSTDEDTGEVVFDLTGKDITIFIPDTEGNAAQIYLTPQN